MGHYAAHLDMLLHNDWASYEESLPPTSHTSTMLSYNFDGTHSFHSYSTAQSYEHGVLSASPTASESSVYQHGDNARVAQACLPCQQGHRRCGPRRDGDCGRCKVRGIRCTYQTHRERSLEQSKIAARSPEITGVHRSLPTARHRRHTAPYYSVASPTAKLVNTARARVAGFDVQDVMLHNCGQTSWSRSSPHLPQETGGVSSSRKWSGVMQYVDADSVSPVGRAIDQHEIHYPDAREVYSHVLLAHTNYGKHPHWGSTAHDNGAGSYAPDFASVAQDGVPRTNSLETQGDVSDSFEMTPSPTRLPITTLSSTSEAALGPSSALNSPTDHVADLVQTFDQTAFFHSRTSCS